MSAARHEPWVMYLSGGPLPVQEGPPPQKQKIRVIRCGEGTFTDKEGNLLTDTPEGPMYCSFVAVQKTLTHVQLDLADGRRITLPIVGTQNLTQEQPDA
jgi:hypothetical protein